MLSSLFSKSSRTLLKRIAAATGIALTLSATAVEAQSLNGPGTRMLNSDSNIDLGTPQPFPRLYRQADPATVDTTPTEVKPPNPIYDRARFPQLWNRPAHAPAVEEVRIAGNYPRGSILIDHARQYLYVMESNGLALQFPVVVGRAGREISGTNHVVTEVVDDPTWQAPPGDRSPNPFAVPGPGNPLGVRGIYLAPPGQAEQGYVIHGTNMPDVFNLPDGQRKASNGCIRMLNTDVMRVAEMVQRGTSVTIFYRNELAPRITRADGSRVAPLPATRALRP